MAKLIVSIFLALVVVSLAAPAPGDVEDYQGNQDHGRVRRHGGLAGYGGGFGGVGYGGHEGHGGHGLGHGGHEGHVGHGLGHPSFPIGSSQSYSKSSASASSVSGGGSVLG